MIMASDGFWVDDVCDAQKRALRDVIDYVRIPTAEPVVAPTGILVQCSLSTLYGVHWWFPFKEPPVETSKGPTSSPVKDVTNVMCLCHVPFSRRL